MDDAEHDEGGPHRHQEYGGRRIRTSARWLGKSRSSDRTEADHGCDPDHPPVRKGSAARFRFGDNKIKIVTVMGTVLSATATAIGSSPPSACHIAPDRPLLGGCESTTLSDTRG